MIGLWAAKTATQSHRLEDINQGYQDLFDGKNVRGIVVYDA